MKSIKGKAKSSLSIPNPLYTPCVQLKHNGGLTRPTTSRRCLFKPKKKCWTLLPALWANIVKRIAKTHPHSVIHFAMSSKENAKIIEELVFPDMSLQALYYTIPSLTSVRFRGFISLWLDHGNVDACTIIGTYIGWYKDYPDAAIALLDEAALKGHPQAIYNAHLIYRLLAPHRIPKANLALLIVERHHLDNIKFYECQDNLLLMLTCRAMEKGEVGVRHCTAVGVEHRELSPGHLNWRGMSCPVCILDSEVRSMRNLI